MGQDSAKDRITGYLKSFSAQQLAIIGVLGVVAVFSALTFFKWVSAPSYRVLATGVTAEEANDIVEQLDSEGISYELVDGGTTVRVPESDIEEAKLALAGAGIGSSTVVGYEIFDNQSFTASDAQQRIAYQRALQGELTRAIMAIEGVKWATVQIGLPPERLFTDEQDPVEASVLLDTGGRASRSTVESIVQLVASSVPGLEADNVSVTDTSGRVLAGPGAGHGTSGGDALTMKRDYEMALAAQAESMLAQVYGPGAVTVRVTAEMDFSEREEEVTEYVPENTVPIRESTSTETFEGTGSGPNGIVGVEGSELGGGSGESTYESSETVTERVVDSTVTRLRSAGGRVERLSVAAIVDPNAFAAARGEEGGAAADVEPPDADEVEALVQAAVGYDAERGDNVVVSELAFSPVAGTADGEPLVLPGTEAEEESPILDYVRTGVGVVVLLVALLLLRKGLRSTREEIDLRELEAVQPAGPRPVGALGAGETEHDDTSEQPALPAELRLIDQDPEQVASLLRSWVADRRA